MRLNLLHEFMYNRNTGQFYAMNSGLKVNRPGGIRMMIAPDINLKVASLAVLCSGSVSRENFGVITKTKLINVERFLFVGHYSSFGEAVPRVARVESKDSPKSSICIWYREFLSNHRLLLTAVRS